MPPTQSHYQLSQNRRPSIQSEDDESFDEDERAPLTENTYQSRTEMKGWDVFVVTPDEDEDETKSSKAIEVILKIFKIFVYFFTFVVVLVTSVLSKGTLLLITSNSRGAKTLEVCNKGLGRGKEFEAHIPETERIAWIWCLFFILVVPELFVLFRSTRICVFKSYTKPGGRTFLMVFLVETLHTLGLVLLTFVVLPDLDVVKAAMLTNCLCTLPAFLSLLSRYSGEDKRPGKVILDLLSLLAQVTGFVIWPLIEWHGRSWAIPLSVFLVSVGWWENYIDRRSPLACIRKLSEMKEDLRKSRYFTFIFISIWKMLLIFCTMLGFLYMTMDDIGNLFRSFNPAFKSHPIIVEEVRQSLNSQNLPDLVTVGPLEKEQVPSDHMAPVYVALIQISSSLICYVFAKFSCKICIQGFSFAFPVSLTIPVTISLLIAACGVRSEDSCFFQHYLPRYLFWTCPDGDFFQEFVTREHAWIWILWLLAQTWVAVHIWTPKAERLASTEKLFVNPMYVGALIDQSLALNRRRDDEGEIKSEEIDLEVPDDNDISQYYETISLHTETSGSQAGGGTKEVKGVKNGPTNNGTVPVNRSADHITRIYACATMWHETSEEMIQMLKSIIRMDEDQAARRNAQKYLRIVDPDYYEFEVHVFFDDAFELSDDNDEEMVVNRFVKLMVRVIDTAASNVHECNVRLRPPKKLPTPYGGRLVWTLPGGNKLISHLKDKGKIRHRKRWSQVMYMYYLLGHRLMELPIDVNRKAVMAENTYILTLDGDINFRPQAVQLLVDLMKKNRNLGAACGRIHPVGTGPMVWYQMFEYAIGHWFQKATEHMIGCVLCSPGCFSLFRAKGLMDDNVMRRYTIKSDEPLHYVQYDQGEDRWLCTLLLQRGYRVEYSAASDAYTHCPEGFGEFYTQRRRWGPSTMANIMDLLCDYKRTVAVNDNISVPYIIYQAMLMIGTVLGPGTIFLMLVGAMVAAFKISNWYSFTYNIIPILFFMFVCFVANNNIQILLAQIMSAGYALLMMAVLVGTSIQLTEDGVGSPSSIFLIALSSSFFIAACLHPQEFWCVVPGFLYFLSVPSMYLLQIVYSLVNLNVVTWGTRETQTKKTKKEMEDEKKEAEEMKKKKRSDAFSWLGMMNSTDNDEEGSISISLANLFKCMFCTYPKPNDEKIQLARISDQLDLLTKKLNSMERHVEGGSGGSFSRRRISSGRGPNRKNETLSSVAEGEEDPGDFSNPESMSEESERLEPRQERDDLINPYWIEDKDLKRGEVEYLSGPEIQFWKELIEKYLYPLDQNKEHQARVASELKELRNKVVFAFFMTNALFILIVFLLQLNKDTLHIIWPLGVKTNITYIPETSEIRIDKEYLELEPIGLVFATFFGLILIIQFTAMLFHRFGTLSHILASVELNCFNRKVDEVSDEALIRKNAVQIAKAFQRLKGIDGDYTKGGGSDDHRPAKRKTIHNLEKRKNQTNKIGTLDVAFRKRFMSFSANENPGKEVGTPVLSGLQRLSIRHDTLKALEVRRNTVFGGNPSRMKTLGAKNEYAANGGHRRPRPQLGSTLRTDPAYPGSANGDPGFNNSGYEGSSDEELGRLRMQIYGTGSRHSAAGSTYREENESALSPRRPSRASNL